MTLLRMPLSMPFKNWRRRLRFAQPEPEHR